MTTKAARAERPSEFPGGGRYGWLAHIETLDPVADAHEIHRITGGFEFPWDYKRALEFALFRTYCVPSISRVLVESGEFERRPQKRYDDTALLMAEMLEHGYDSPRGRSALRTVNRQHGRYTIAGDDMRYVLSTFVYDPLDWIDRYGWRALHPHERLAAFHFYREVGKRMGIKGIPADFDEFREFKADYENTRFRYSDDNRAIGQYTVRLFASWFPAPLRPVVRRGVYAMVDDTMRDAFGFPPASPLVRRAIDAALAVRARAERLMPPRTVSVAIDGDPGNRTYPGYPEGYTPADLGADRPAPEQESRRESS